MTFETWYWEYWEPENSNVSEITKGDLEQAYKAGWEAFRDKCGGMYYEETLKNE